VDHLGHVKCVKFNINFSTVYLIKKDIVGEVLLTSI